MGKKKRSSGKRKKAGGKKKQVGKGLVEAFENLRAAANHAKHLPKDNFFRRSTVNRYGIPKAIQKKMYAYN